MFALLGKVVGGGVIGLILLAIFWTLSALFWGWLLMLVLGAFGATHNGHSFGYGFCFLIGYPISLVLG